MDDPDRRGCCNRCGTKGHLAKSCLATAQDASKFLKMLENEAKVKKSRSKTEHNDGLVIIEDEEQRITPSK